jgi:phosphoribosylanthranilate isomerase
MWVKICGNTNLEDAALAAQLGADAVGFVFAPGKRQMTAAQVAAITPHLPGNVERVGVFDSHDADEIAGVVFASGLTAVQLHGGLDEATLAGLVDRLGGRARIIQTLHWTIEERALHEPTAAEQLATQIARVAGLGLADRILIDSKLGSALGGTGVAFDWGAARDAFAAVPAGLRLIVAGGLTPVNVALAIAQLGPWGVDVSSGVEQAPGRKDPERLIRFIENARAAARPG